MKNINSTSRINKAWPALLLAVFCFTACEDLTEKPAGIATPTTFYSSTLQCEAALAGAMAPLWGWYVSNSYGDGSGLAGTFANDDQMEGGDLIIAEGHATNLWTGHYRSIVNINSLLNAVLNKESLSKFPQDEVDVIVGQAKFLRAFNYFYLVRMFGDLPLLTEDTPDPIKTPITARTPIAQVYELIIEDFTFAMDVLPSKTDLDGSNPGRPTSGAAKGFLAKVYFTMATAPLNDVSKFAEAAKLSKEIIDEGEYSLIPDINDVFLQGNKYGSEQMWSFNSTVDDRQVDALGGKPDEIEGYGGEHVAVDFDTSFVDQPRKDAYLLRYLIIDGDSVGYDGLSSGTPYIRKLYNEPYISLDEQDGGSTANWFILRYADILLIYAEAQNQVGLNQDAVDALNQIIKRANGATGTEPLATLAMSKSAFDAKVIQERSWELCFELGDRWFDLVRKRMIEEANEDNPDAVNNFSTDPNPYYYLFPIPTVDATLIGQNPGYNF
jgi:hypothetical protein